MPLAHPDANSSWLACADTAVIVASMTADGLTDALVIVAPVVGVLLATSVVQLTLCFYVFEAILDPCV